MSNTRPLTPDEKMVYALIRDFENACDERRDIVVIRFEKTYLERLLKARILDTLRIIPDPESESKVRVFITIKEYLHYVRFHCVRVGLKPTLTGAIETRDNLAIKAPDPTPVPKGRTIQ